MGRFPSRSLSQKCKGMPGYLLSAETARWHSSLFWLPSGELYVASRVGGFLSVSDTVSNTTTAR